MEGVEVRTFMFVEGYELKLRLGPNHTVDGWRVIFEKFERGAASGQFILRYHGRELEDVEYLCELGEEPTDVALDKRVTNHIILRNPEGSIVALPWQKGITLDEVAACTGAAELVWDGTVYPGG
jgi:hypothetical protein